MYNDLRLIRALMWFAVGFLGVVACALLAEVLR